MSMLNPGKRGILTVIALMLIVGVPGVIAYADSSDDTYMSNLDDSVLPNKVTMYNSGTNYEFGITAVESDDGLDIVVDSVAKDDVTELSSLTSVTRYIISASSANLASMFDKISVATDLGADSVFVMMFDSDSNLIGSLELTADDDGIYSKELSAVEKVAYENSSWFAVRVNVASAEAVSTFYFDVDLYSAETIFTDDTVELIVMVGGIALLICGTFALSFIDVDTPGKAVSYAKRGIRSAGKKMRRGKK